jgi:hypothetical protein
VTPARTALAAVSAAGAVAVGAAVWGTCIERFLFTVRRHELDILPAGSPSLTVLHLSDAHGSVAASQAAVDRPARRRGPTRSRREHGRQPRPCRGLRGIRAAFAPLRGVPGVFVHGSNDVSGPSARNPLNYFRGPSGGPHNVEKLDTAAMDAYFTDELGWTNLNNTAAVVEAGGLRLETFGVSDAHREWDDLPALPAAIEARDAVASSTPHAMRTS